MNENDITDKRGIKEFKGITFSKYKKTDAKKELLNNLSTGKIEPACYWAAEYICAGHYADIWEIILFFCSKHIHLGNPKLPIYLDLRLQHFKQILNGGYQDNILKMRNNDKIRKLFGEIVSVLCLSKKKHTFDNIKISKDDFNITKITYKYRPTRGQQHRKLVRCRRAGARQRARARTAVGLVARASSRGASPPGARAARERRGPGARPLSTASPLVPLELQPVQVRREGAALCPRPLRASLPH